MSTLPGPEQMPTTVLTSNQQPSSEKISDNHDMQTKEEKQRVGNTIKKINNALNARDPNLTRWNDNLSRQQFEKNSREVERRKRLGMSSLRIPMEFAFVESKTADEIDTLPFPRVIPTNTQDIMKAQQFKKLFDYVVDNKLNLKELFMRGFNKQKNTLGDMIVKVYWNKEERVTRKPVKKKKNGEIKYKEKTITVYDDVKVDLVDVRNFAIDPMVYQAGKTLADANNCTFFSLYEYEAFQKLFGEREGFKNIDMVTPQATWLNTTWKSNKEARSDVEERQVEVAEYWDILNDQLIIMANGIEIRESSIPYENPFTGAKSLPIAHFVDHMSSTGFFNFGEIDLVKDLSEERETQRNINLDAAKGYTHPFLMLGGINDLDVDEIAFGPNGIAHVDDINQVKQINMSGNTGLPFNLEASNQNDSVIVTGHDVSGVLGVPGETATKTLEKRESQIKRTRYGLAYNEVNGFKRLYVLIKNLVLQYYKSDHVKNIVGEDGQQLFDDYKEAIKMFDQDYDVMVVANNQIPASKEIQKLRNQEMLATLGALPFDPNTGQLPAHLVEPVRKILFDFDIPMDTVDRMVPEQQATPQQGGDDGEQDLQAALEQAQMAGVPLEGGGGQFERQQGTPANSEQPGVQQKVQSQIQGAIG